MSREPRRARLGVVAPAALSACVDASVLAVPAASAMVSTVMQELSKAFMLKKWFHGKLSASEAERLMMQRGKNGCYLVRESRSSPGDYVLSVRVRGRVSHVIIRKLNKKYETGAGEQFDDLSELIEHYRTYPIVESTGDVLRLLQPLAFTRTRTVEKLTDDADDLQDKTICLKNRDFYRQEMEYLQYEMEVQNNLTTFEGLTPENKNKNRYRNVLPYDQTRVILRNKHSNSEEGSDYINANYIHFDDRDTDTSSTSSSVDSSSTSDSTKKVYIATQGSLVTTEDDFYHMLWQENVGVVVMLTKELEHGKWKCSEYWPGPESKKELDCFSLELISQEFHRSYTRRVIQMKKSVETKTVTQYQFQTWPDHRCPPDVESVLTLIEDVNEELRKRKNSSMDKSTLCVHCSAGVGRTGTFIVIDHLLTQIKEKGEKYNIDVRATVREARKQRWGLVHNLTQYMFIYEAILTYLQKNQKELNAEEE